MRILLKYLSGLLRRLIGGWQYTAKIISERGVQWLIGFIIYGAAIAIQVNWFGGYHTFLYDKLNVWVFAILGIVSVMLCLTKGHFPGFMCGTESLEYINEQLANGRKIKFQKIVDWIGKKRGLEQFGREWCFWQLLLCKTTACILPALFFGSQFIAVGILVTFAYNAMFWVNPKPIGASVNSPTNWGEAVQGYMVMSALF